MFPPESTPTVGEPKRDGLVQDRRHRSRTGRLDDHLRPLERRQDGAGE